MNESTRVQEAADKLVEAELADKLDPCSEQEVAQLEEHFGIRLPTAYRQFLKTMGKKAGTFMVGTDAFFPGLLALRGHANELLAEYDAAPLSASAFVFCMHQGYQFLFFDTATSADDPPVQRYIEDGQIEEVADSFSAWLLDFVTEESG